MGYENNPSIDGKGLNSFYRLPPSATSQYIDPEKDYEVSDAEVGWDYRLHYIPSTLYLDVLISGRSTTSGKAASLGLRTPITTDPARDFSVFLGKGSLGVGVPVLSPTRPWFGVGNIYWQPGRGLSFGWFSMESAPCPYMIAAGAAIALFQTVVEGCGGSDECALQFISNLMVASTPINTLREIAQKMGIDSSEEACSDLGEQNGYDRCMIYSTSYRKQLLFQVAYDMVGDGIDSLKSDPYIRASLLAEKDVIKSEELERGMPIGAHSAIAENTASVAADVQSFMDEHGEWLSKGAGQRPSEEDILRFMGGSLYLMQKLQLSATLDENRLEIRGSAPMAFESAGGIVRFIETAAAAYDAIAKSRSLWGFIAGKLDRHIDLLTFGSYQISTESLINHWFRYKNLRTWIYEMSSPNIQALFKLRKIHLISILKKDFKGENRDKYIERVRGARIPEDDTLQNTESLAMDRLAPMRMHIDFLSGNSQIFNGMELLLRLSCDEDPLAEVVGLDLKGIVRTPPIYTGFEILYQVKRMNWDDRQLYYSSLREHADRLAERIVKYHRDEIDGELDGYKSTIEEKSSAVEESHQRLGELLNKIRSKGATVSETTSDTVALFAEGHFAADDRLDLEDLMNSADSDIQAFERLMAGLQSEFEKELTRLSKDAAIMADPKEIEEMAADIGSAFNEMNGRFYSLMSYRIGVNMMRIYVNGGKKP